jgi:hypothetical protein
MKKEAEEEEAQQIYLVTLKKTQFQKVCKNA